MKLKITKCSDDDFWYKNNIGDIHDILITDYIIGQHIIKMPKWFGFGGKSVDFRDCELIL